MYGSRIRKDKLGLAVFGDGVSLSEYTEQFTTDPVPSEGEPTAETGTVPPNEGSDLGKTGISATGIEAPIQPDAIESGKNVD